MGAWVMIPTTILGTTLQQVVVVVCGCFEAVSDGLKYPGKDRSLGEQGLLDSPPL